MGRKSWKGDKEAKSEENGEEAQTPDEYAA